MQPNEFLTSLETKLKSGDSSEHAFRPPLELLLTTSIPGCTVINEPRRLDRYNAPDMLIKRGTTPIGHLEAKTVGTDLPQIIIDSECEIPQTDNGNQLRRYRAVFPNLLLTDGLEWHWFVNGEPRLETPVCIGTWHRRTNTLTHAAPDTLIDLLTQFAAQHVPTVNSSSDLAHRLALVAAWMRDVIQEIFKTESYHGSLHDQLDAFRETLLPMLSPAEFADMYAQTIAYGLFAARVDVPDGTPFTRYDAARTIPRTNPFLRKLFHELAGYDLEEKLAWLVDDCAMVLERTNMTAILHDFGKATRQEDPIIHFYETFLELYDPYTRERRGVYYTPEPVVNYLVRSIDHLLRTHFRKPMGLADESVVVLDPAAGTGTFLHAVIQQIHETLCDAGVETAWNEYVATKLLPRVVGFELLMAPYAIAHLKLGLLLERLGYTFGSNERLGVYLTNTLSDPPKRQYAMPFARYIAEEGQAAMDVRHQKPVMVVMGNPPYSGHSANQSEWIGNLLRGTLPDGTATESYYDVEGQPLGERNPKWLQDDYVKFIRFGQWRINRTGGGILTFISNNGYLDNVTFRGMRESLLQEFDHIYLLNLHGSTKKKERAPDGTPDDNVFDIQQGVTIGIFVKDDDTGDRTEKAHVWYADLWGRRERKYAALNDQDIQSTPWQQLQPKAPWYLFVPQDTAAEAEYMQGWQLRDIFPVSSVGIVTGQDSKVIAFTKKEAEVLAQKQDVSTETISRTLYRPFDHRFLLYSPSVVTRMRTAVMRNMNAQENISFMTTRGIEIQRGFEHVFVVNTLATSHAVSLKEGNYLFPLYLYRNGKEPDMFYGYSNGRGPNFTTAFTDALTQRIGLTFIPDGSGDLIQTVGPEDVFHYIYAILHCPTYRTRYAQFLKIDFPRVPLIDDRDLFVALIAKGAELVDLHLLRPSGSKGIGGSGGAAILDMPGRHGVRLGGSKGSHPVERPIYHPPTGDQAGRVMIHAQQWFEGIDPETWAMQIGGYQPLDKWLRERVGRILSFDEIQHYLRMVLALRETRRLMEEIDELIPGWPLAHQE